MTRTEQVALIGKLHLKKGSNYILFISKESGLSRRDAVELDSLLYKQKMGKIQIVLADGNVSNLLKVVEVKK